MPELLESMIHRDYHHTGPAWGLSTGFRWNARKSGCARSILRHDLGRTHSEIPPETASGGPCRHSGGNGSAYGHLVGLELLRGAVLVDELLEFVDLAGQGDGFRRRAAGVEDGELKGPLQSLDLRLSTLQLSAEGHSLVLVDGRVREDALQQASTSRVSAQSGPCRSALGLDVTGDPLDVRAKSVDPLPDGSNLLDDSSVVHH